MPALACLLQRLEPFLVVAALCGPAADVVDARDLPPTIVIGLYRAFVNFQLDAILYLVQDLAAEAGRASHLEQAIRAYGHEDIIADLDRSSDRLSAPEVGAEPQLRSVAFGHPTGEFVVANTPPAIAIRVYRSFEHANDGVRRITAGLVTRSAG